MRDLTAKIRGLQMVQAYVIIGLISALYVHALHPLHLGKTL